MTFTKLCYWNFTFSVQNDDETAAFDEWLSGCGEPAQPMAETSVRWDDSEDDQSTAGIDDLACVNYFSSHLFGGKTAKECIRSFTLGYEWGRSGPEELRKADMRWCQLEWHQQFPNLSHLALLMSTEETHDEYGNPEDVQTILGFLPFKALARLRSLKVVWLNLDVDDNIFQEGERVWKIFIELRNWLLRKRGGGHQIHSLSRQTTTKVKPKVKVIMHIRDGVEEGMEWSRLSRHGKTLVRRKAQVHTHGLEMPCAGFLGS